MYRYCVFSGYLHYLCQEHPELVEETFADDDGAVQHISFAGADEFTRIR